MITYTKRFCQRFMQLGFAFPTASMILQKSNEPQCPSYSLNPLHIDDDVYFYDCGFIGDTTSITNDKSVDINFTMNEEQFQHIKFTVLQTLFETFLNKKVENKKLLAKKIFKTKVLCTYNKEEKYAIMMGNEPKLMTRN